MKLTSRWFALWLLPVVAFGQAVTEPHLDRSSDPVSVSFGDQSFVNEGLVGAGSLPAGAIDVWGDTIGSFSSLQIRDWRRVGSHYEGVLWTLPDRGPNDPAAGRFYDYASRLHRFRIRFTPQDGRLVILPDGGLRLRDERGRLFTGADPGKGTLVLKGIELPSSSSGLGAGKVSMDAESLQFRDDGSFYVGDEYAANVYFFDKRARLRGVIQPPPAIVPRTDGRVDFGSIAPPQTGRRNNQGVEGMSLSPDGRTLIVALQSALIQDTARGEAQGRVNTRVLVYDVTATPTPVTPIGHFIVQLPAYNNLGNGAAPNRTAAQSEVRALNDHQFLMLSRDSAGLGAALDDPVMYKSILLVDTHGASNLVGTSYETSVQSVLQRSDDTALRPELVPAPWVEFINMLNPVQLARFGLEVPKLSEKWEAMDIVSTKDAKSPNDYLLFVGNDNDFTARKCRISGQVCDGRLDNDNRILVYRIRLPQRLK